MPTEQKPRSRPPARLDARFELSARGTNTRTEVLAGATTFLTMAYIIVVNPAILGQAGMPVAAVAAATCFAAGIASILMGLVANVPLALAPGMGLNAYFSFTVVQGMGVPWPVALGCVLISGVAFLILTAAGIRQMILAAIPPHLLAAVAGGIGLFIGFVGLKNSGIVVSNPATGVGLGDLHAPGAVLAVIGLAATAVLSAWRVKGAVLIGIVATTVAGWAMGLVSFTPQPYSLGAMTATVIGSLAGTSTVTSYVESAAGVEAGGRTGLTAIVTGVLFLIAMFAAPYAQLVPLAATAPALILVGALMMAPLAEVAWDDPEAAIPAFLTVAMIPLSFSIANGLAFGITAHALLKLARGKIRPADWLLLVLAALFVIRFVWLTAA
jgi:AGZA family xanthine/uracil permease-like MFS transporter